MGLLSRRCSHDLSNSDSGTETPKSKLTIFHLPWQESQTVELGQGHLGKDGARSLKETLHSGCEGGSDPPARRGPRPPAWPRSGLALGWTPPIQFI